MNESVGEWLSEWTFEWKNQWKGKIQKRINEGGNQCISADEFNQEELLGFRGCGCRFLLCGHVFFFGCVMIVGDIAIAVDLIAAAAAVVIAVVAVIVIAF